MVQCQDCSKQSVDHTQHQNPNQRVSNCKFIQLTIKLSRTKMEFSSLLDSGRQPSSPALDLVNHSGCDDDLDKNNNMIMQRDIVDSVLDNVIKVSDDTNPLSMRQNNPSSDKCDSIDSTYRLDQYQSPEYAINYNMMSSTNLIKNSDTFDDLNSTATNTEIYSNNSMQQSSSIFVDTDNLYQLAGQSSTFDSVPPTPNYLDMIQINQNFESTLKFILSPEIQSSTGQTNSLSNVSPSSQRRFIPNQPIDTISDKNLQSAAADGHDQESHDLMKTLIGNNQPLETPPSMSIFNGFFVNHNYNNHGQFGNHAPIPSPLPIYDQIHSPSGYGNFQNTRQPHQVHDTTRVHEQNHINNNNNNSNSNNISLQNYQDTYTYGPSKASYRKYVEQSQQFGTNRQNANGSRRRHKIPPLGAHYNNNVSDSSSTRDYGNRKSEHKTYGSNRSNQHSLLGNELLTGILAGSKEKEMMMIAMGTTTTTTNEQAALGSQQAASNQIKLNMQTKGQMVSPDVGGERFSRKVFVGGLPPDIDEEEIKSSFRCFGSLVVDWPHKAESRSYFPPKGYAFLLFQDELSVQKLIDACISEDGKIYYSVSSPTMKDKPVQIRPWRLSDSDYVLDSTLALDPRKTVFVGGVPRPLKAHELALIMAKLYGGVCYAGIDTDPELKYPKGAGRVAFSNHHSYIAAISARFVHLKHEDIDKRVEVKPYVLDDQYCDECKVSNSSQSPSSSSSSSSQATIIISSRNHQGIEDGSNDNNNTRNNDKLASTSKHYNDNLEQIRRCTLDSIGNGNNNDGHGDDMRFAPFFCASINCLRYYCENCWSKVHSQPGREYHKPLVKEGSDRARSLPVSGRWNHMI